MFDRLLNYRYYRLKVRSDLRNADAMREAQIRMKSMHGTLGENKFSKSYPILIFDFLKRFTEEDDFLGMSQGKAFISLPHYFKGGAEIQFRTQLYGSKYGGAGTCTESV